MILRDYIIKMYVTCMARKAFTGINWFFFKLSNRGLGINNYDSEGNLTGERNFIEKILPTLIHSEKPIIFDVGANVGNYCCELLKTFPKANIYAFEPHPITYNHLLKNTKGGVHAINVACSDTAGEIKLYDYASDVDGTEHASLYKDVFTDIYVSDVKSINTIVIRLDKYADDNNIDYIDFLKIDTEGNEYKVLLGCSGLLSYKKIGVIQFEFNKMNVISRVYMKDFYDILKEYEIFRLLPKEMLPMKNYNSATHEIFSYQNIVAIHKSLLQSYTTFIIKQ